jgi:hypothetical protein
MKEMTGDVKLERNILNETFNTRGGIWRGANKLNWKGKCHVNGL